MCVTLSVVMINRGYSTSLRTAMAVAVAARSKLRRQIIVGDSSSFVLALDFLTAFFMLHLCSSVLIHSDYSILVRSCSSKLPV